MSCDHSDRHARQDNRNEARLRRVPAREWPTGPLGDALHAVSVQWTAMHAVDGESPSAWESERLASRIYTLAHAASFENFEHRAEMFAEIAVLALAGVARADAAAIVDPTSGSAAA